MSKVGHGGFGLSLAAELAAGRLTTSQFKLKLREGTVLFE